MGLSTALTMAVNLVGMLAGGTVFGAGVWLGTRGDGVECFSFLHWALIIVGAVLFVVALVGFVGACCQVSALLWVYLFVVFLVLIGLSAFTVFAFVVTNKSASAAVAGQGFKDYRLADYSAWLQRRVNDTNTWNTVRSCISKADPCTELAAKYATEDSLYAAKLSPIQAGCCIPPLDCGYTFVNATYFTVPSSGAANSSDADCANYNNSSSENLCYGCDTCKAGVLENVQRSWRIVSFVNLGVLIFIFAVYSIGCCAYRHARSGTEFGYLKGF